MKTVAWFSSGVSSAVAIKLSIKNIDEIIYVHIEDQHTDTLRFIHNCEDWFGKPIEILQSPLKNVENACRMAGGRGYINGVGGASCTLRLKKRVRKEWEHRQVEELRYVWGMDCTEYKRCEKICDTMPGYVHIFPLVDFRITKEKAHLILKANGLRRPAMYDLGYNNNNCIGCVKGGMGYWNHIRVDFPEVFNARARMERVIGASCIRGCYLDELDPSRGRHTPPIVNDCGVLCEQYEV